MASGGFPMRNAWRVLLPISGLVLLAACGGSGTLVAGGGTGGTGISTGVMTVGSIIVNGVRFDDNLATVTIDDAPGSRAQLDNGMVVTVRGTFNDDGLTGQADAIEVENEVRGTVTATGIDNLTVLGQAILVNGATVFANVEDLASINAGIDNVEVHGNRTAGGTIVASRVELVTGAELLDELRGTVSEFTAGGTTFFIGTQEVSFTTSAVRPEGATFGNDDLVEVRGTLNPATGVLEAATVGVEDLQDVDFQPTEGGKFEVEGFVSGFVPPISPSTVFLVGRQQVRPSANVRFKGGLPTDLRDGIIVEAKGTFSGGILVATEIELEDSVKMEATMETQAASSFTALGKTILVTSQTVQEPSDFFATAEAGTTRLELRGFENLDGTITALRLRAGGADDILQGIVTAFDAGNGTLSILGITIDASDPLVKFFDDRDNTDAEIDRAVFFGSLVDGSTIVKAKGPQGAFDPGPPAILSATEVELE